jgi:GNAT superfamily N-acetyltransferase
MQTLTLRPLQASDIVPIAAAFAAIGWNKPAEQYERYLAEQSAGRRVTLIALVDHGFAGYVNVEWDSPYAPFRAAGIPEITDFNVLPSFQRRGIGSALLTAAESLAATRADTVGIGVGMTADYGAAQRLYARRGYIPDGLGLHVDGRPVAHGQSVAVDDSLVLSFTKRLR